MKENSSKMADQDNETFKPGDEKEAVKAAEDLLKQQRKNDKRGEENHMEPKETNKPPIDLREWALQESQNPSRESDVEESVKRCQEKRLTTFQATVGLFDKEQTMFWRKWADSPYEERAIEGRMDVVNGFGLVAVWAKGLLSYQRQHYMTAEELTSLKKELVEKMFSYARRHNLPVPDLKVDEETGEQVKKLGQLMSEDPSGFSGLDYYVQQFKESLEEIRRNKPRSYFAKTDPHKLIGAEIAVDRFKEIFNQIEHSSWGSPEPDSPQTTS